MFSTIQCVCNIQNSGRTFRYSEYKKRIKLHGIHVQVMNIKYTKYYFTDLFGSITSQYNNTHLIRFLLLYFLLYLRSLNSSYSISKHVSKRSKYKEVSSMNCMARESHARGVYPTQDTPRMGTARLKQEEEDTRIIVK